MGRARDRRLLEALLKRLHQTAALTVPPGDLRAAVNAILDRNRR